MERMLGDTLMSRGAVHARGTPDAAPAIGGEQTQEQSKRTFPFSKPSSMGGCPTYLLISRHVEQIVEILVASSQKGPHRTGTLGNVVHLSLAGAVSKEGPI